MKSTSTWMWSAALAISSGAAFACSQPVLGTIVAAAVAFAWSRHQASQAAETAQFTLTRALTRRDEHLAHTAHELRTPLTSVLSALELVRSGYATSAEEIAEFLDEADLAARHLAFLINDVLDAAAMQSGRLRLDLRGHAVVTILADARRMLAPSAVRRGIALEFVSPPPNLAVHTDARRCLQVLMNLVTNAMKFSTPGSPVELQVAANGPRVRFAVVDHGAGVPPEARDRLFRAFEQAHSDRSIDGTGLGLHITRRLIDQLGGDIGYRPGVERGSEFWFELPRHQPESSIALELVAAR